ncbi:MAG: hypothetical protein LBL07_17815 [Tannerella sp.]|jgi:hypothetical protein|nr:hypothetical protein [Tannerella sp.]
MSTRLFPVILFASLSCFLYGQNKYSYVYFNNLTEVEGTEYVIARMEEMGKMLKRNEQYLLFINTTNGDTNQADFHKGANIREIKQVKLENRGINRIILLAQTIPSNEKKGMGWQDPVQLFVLSTDGKEKKQLTENHFFVQTWTVCKETGKIVITGHYDANMNGKYDKTDKHEILIYDLETFELTAKI